VAKFGSWMAKLVGDGWLSWWEMGGKVGEVGAKFERWVAKLEAHGWLSW
jgi:hypothetical protein